MKAKICFWLCLGGAVLFLSFVVYCSIFQPLWVALMGVGILGIGCLTHTFHDLRKPDLEKYDPIGFV